MKGIRETKAIKIVNFDEFAKQIKELTLEQKAEIVNELLKNNLGGIVIIGNNNLITNSNIIQLDGSTEEISEQLKNISEEKFAQLIEAVGLTMKKKNQK